MKKIILITISFILLLALIPTITFFSLKNGIKKQNTKIVYKNTKKTNISNSNKKTFKIFDDQTKTVKTIDACEYIKGVVYAEVPSSFHIEAIKAQAVAAYTYALRKAEFAKKTPNPLIKGADLSTSYKTHQAYISKEQAQKLNPKNFEKKWGIISKAVESVFGEVMVYNGEIIVAAFHSTSSGVTEDAKSVWGSEVPYLKSVESSGDKNSPKFNQKFVFNSSDVKAKLKQFNNKYNENLNANQLIITEKTKTGLVSTVKAGNITLSGLEIKSMFSLASASFNIIKDGDNYVFSTYGYGHGVGLSQYGANYLANRGQNYKQILKHYYTNIDIIKPEI